ncbi:MAG: hypothetical protein EKK41_18695 [Hyphomicrobiales bacterium]|nr:MAG: hypothetical protein EKK41_18695 [Hyphomicrobiales bacterium]
MRYADRALSADEHSRITKLIAEDASIRARLAVFTETGRGLAEPFNIILNAPVPQHLVDIVVGTRRSEGARGTSGGRGQAFWRDVVDSLSFGVGRSSFAWAPAAACAAIAISIAIGWFAHGLAGDAGSASDLFALRDGRLIALGSLARVLETAQSGRAIQIAGGDATSIKVRLTYRTQAQGYCRQYEIARTDGGRLAGNGCRSVDGTWYLTFTAPLDASKTAPGTGIAGDASAILDAIVKQTAVGDSFGHEEEDEALGRKWSSK